MLAHTTAPSSVSWMEADELRAAICHGRVAAVKKFLRDRSPEHIAGLRGLLPLAARAGQDALCEMLLDFGVPVDEREEETGMTALMWAAANVESNLVKLLLRAGANPILKTRIGGALPQREPGTAADLSQLKLDSRSSDPAWSRCAHECIAILQEASRVRRHRARQRFQRVIRLIVCLLAWRARAADRTYAPGGVGYMHARDDFDARCESQQWQGHL